MKKGDKVMILFGEYRGEVGTVKEVINTERGDICIVKLGNGDMLKVFSNEIEKIAIAEDKPAEETITISRKDFVSAVEKVTDYEAFRKDVSPTTAFMLSMSGILFCQKLETELFGPRKND